MTSGGVLSFIDPPSLCHSTVLWSVWCHHVSMFLLIFDLNKCWVAMVILHWLFVLLFSPICHGYMCLFTLRTFILWIQLLATTILSCVHTQIQTDMFVLLLVINHGPNGCFIYTVYIVMHSFYLIGSHIHFQA